MSVDVDPAGQPIAPPPPPPKPNRRIKPVPVLVIGVIVAAIFGGAIALSVGNDDDTGNTPVAVDDDTATTDDTKPATDDESATEPPAVSEPAPSTTTTTVPEIVNVGPNEWYEWTDGLQAQVTAVEQFTPEYDSTPTPDVVVTVTIKNGTGAAYDGTMATVNLYGGPNGTQAESEYTYYGFDGSIPPGSTATAKWSFTVPPEHLGDLRIEVAPGWSDDTYMTEYEPAFFHGSAV